MLPLRGAKRKAVHVDVEAVTRKRTRRSPDPDTPCSRSSENADDTSDEDDRVSNEEPSSTAAPTPLSSASLTQPDQRPSRLKNQQCPYPNCPKAFARRARLNEHIRSHTNTRPFLCPHPPCTKDFLRESHLKHHIKSAHSNERDYACTHAGCDKAYTTGTRLRRHLATHKKKEIYTCKAPGCGQAFRKHATLQAHISSEHEGKAPYPCGEIGEDGIPCGAGFDTLTKWKTHMGRIHGQDRYFCTLCSNVNDEETEVGIESVQLSTSETQLSSLCQAATELNSVETNLPPASRPEMTSRGPLEFNKALGYVNKIKNRFSSQPHIYKHFLFILQSYQSGSNPIEVVYAQITELFQFAPDLLEDFGMIVPRPSGQVNTQAATTQSTGDAATSSIEAVQGLGFPTYAAFQAHNKKVHPPKCEKCGYEAVNAHELNRHVEIQHGGQHIAERATNHCREPGCSRSFTRNGNLLIHLKTAHAKGKAYVCGSIDISDLNHVDIANWSGLDACGRGFTAKQSLEDHIRFIHMGVERPRKEQKKKQQNKDKPTRSRKSKASALSRLAGTAYDEDTSRTIACLRLDCPQRFSREYDLDMHMQSAHDLADFEIQYLRAERDGVGPTSYGYQLTSERTAEDLEAERAFDEMFGSTQLTETRGASGYEGNGTEEVLEEAARGGGEFWVGGRSHGDGNMHGNDNWEAEERELRNLIDEDGNEVDDALEEAVYRGGQFWVGGRVYDGDDVDGNDDWEAQEAELRMLIDGDDGDEGDGVEEMVIDPMLR